MRPSCTNQVSKKIIKFEKKTIKGESCSWFCAKVHIVSAIRLDTVVI